MPILQNSQNNSSWPAVVSSDVASQVQYLNRITHVLYGRMKGKMPLSMPSGTDLLENGSVITSNGDMQPQRVFSSRKRAVNGSATTDSHIVEMAARDKAMVHAIESAVIDWTRQIREVLKRDSAQPLIDGKNPTALVELDFWVNKKKSLNSLHDQLTSARVENMQAVLDHEKSSYSSALHDLRKDVLRSLEEATDISKHLEPLRRYIESIEDTAFEDMEKLLTSIFFSIELVWQHSKYYSTARHVVVLLREIMNQVVIAVSNTLDPRSVFAQEVDEGIARPNRAMELIELAERLFSRTRIHINELSSRGRCNPWKFESQLVLARLESFKERVKKILEVFNHAADFFKLEKVEVSNERVRNHNYSFQIS